MTTDIKYRFWSKVDKKGPNDCWLFKGCILQSGYGAFWAFGGPVRAHRIAYMLSKGYFIPKGIMILHKCDTPPCCNPKHLYLGDHSDNMQDMMSRKRMDVSKIAFSKALFSAKDILTIRKLKILKPGCSKVYKYSQETIAKVYGVSTATIYNIWKSDKYPCKEGFYI